MATTPRLTKTVVHQMLLAGKPVIWGGGNKNKISLELPAQRRLFSFLLNQKIREPKNLPETFIQGLQSAFEATDDPATGSTTSVKNKSNGGPWRLHSIETEGFGGLNSWNGPVFHFNFESASHLIEGANGSGKSSLVGAILWALTGERPRDQTNESPHEARPVYGIDDVNVGNWPPIACYPPTYSDLSSKPKVRVTLNFYDPQGNIANVERILDGGEVSSTFDENFNVPSIFFETGILMPTRLATLRFDEPKGRLTDAIQKLTGLDDLVAISTLVSGLCHSSKEYLSALIKEAKSTKAAFSQTLTDIRNTLTPVSEMVPEFDVSVVRTEGSAFQILKRKINERSAALTSVVSEDLAVGLEIQNPAVQMRIMRAIDSAKSDLTLGLEALPMWRLIKSVATHLNEDAYTVVKEAANVAHSKTLEAINLLNRSEGDPKFQLKAMASLWHSSNAEGVIENCPLCESDLTDKHSLAEELRLLALSGAAASKTFNDNLNSIIEELDIKTPPAVKILELALINVEPRDKLIEEIKNQFICNDSYALVFAKFGALLENAIVAIPQGRMAVHSRKPLLAETKKICDKIALIESCLALTDWWQDHSDLWISWWETVYPSDSNICNSVDSGNLNSICGILHRVSEAMTKAEPYRKAAELMEKAEQEGSTAAKIQNELSIREAITDNLSPLKNIGSLAEAVAGDAIEGLSSRIERMLANTLLSDKLKFNRTKINRKDGLIVRGSINKDIHIDATLVANTAWLRAVLWAFIFALREEAVEQAGLDIMPFLVFDDPQATFDGVHRHRWSQYIAELQSNKENAQIILISHDDSFLELVKVSGIKGRDVILIGALDLFGHVKIFEGNALERKWDDVKEIGRAHV